MNKESHQYSFPTNKPVDPSVVRVLQFLDAVTRQLECTYFVVGATARDLVLVNVHGLRPGRATFDIDFGIAVKNWEQFTILKERLTGTREFTPDRRALQRLIYTDRAAGLSIPVDLIPFRGVTSTEGTVAWPLSRDIAMNVTGFEEALRSSVLIEIEDGLTVRVASVPGLALLKLTAWADRGWENNKDAVDLYRLLTAYADVGNTDRLYGPELDLLEAADFNMELAGAELLGRDVASIASLPIMEQVRSLVTSESARERLVNHIAQTTSAESGPSVDRITSAFCRGLLRRR